MTLWGIKRKKTYAIIACTVAGLLFLFSDQAVIGALLLIIAAFLCGAD